MFSFYDEVPESEEFDQFSDEDEFSREYETPQPVEIPAEPDSPPKDLNLNLRISSGKANTELI